jgi:integrase/recombinase XerD
MQSNEVPSSLRRPGRPKNSSTGPARELTKAEIKRLTLCIDGRHAARDRALVHLCLGAGLRISEACSLRVEDVEAGNTLVVQAHNAKSGKARRVYLSEEAQRYVSEYLAERGSCAHGAPLLLSQKGSHMHAGYAVRLFKRLAEQAAVKGATSHSMRRTHANSLRRNGVQLIVIQIQLGHQHLETTSRYLSASPEEHAAAIAGLKYGT